jgi:hypothetical protein
MGSNMTRRRMLLVALVLTAAFVFVLWQSQIKRRAQSTLCGNYMSSISMGAMWWAQDHDGRMASNFLVMSNEINAPKLLVCPSDSVRHWASNWASFSSANCSYEIISPGMDVTNTQTVYFRCLIHGHLGYTDGTVYDGRQRRTKKFW